MEKFSLNGEWRIQSNAYDVIGEIPGSVYSTLLASGKMEAPFYRGNEREALAIMDEEFTLQKSLNIRKKRVKFCSCVRGLIPFAICISTTVSLRIRTICPESTLSIMSKTK